MSPPRILVVEDEPLVALILEEQLVDIGCVVIGPAYALEKAPSLAANKDIEAALVDLTLHHNFTGEVAKLQRYWYDVWPASMSPRISVEGHIES